VPACLVLLGWRLSSSRRPLSCSRMARSRDRAGIESWRAVGVTSSAVSVPVSVRLRQRPVKCLVWAPGLTSPRRSAWSAIGRLRGLGRSPGSGIAAEAGSLGLLDQAVLAGDSAGLKERYGPPSRAGQFM
jgi:hypothetical protein